MVCPLSNTNFLRQTEGRKVEVCKWYMWWGLSTTDFRWCQLAFSRCRSRITLETDICLKGALGFQNEVNCQAEVPHKILSKTKQIGYWEAFHVTKGLRKRFFLSKFQMFKWNKTLKDEREDIDDEWWAGRPSNSWISDNVAKV